MEIQEIEKEIKKLEEENKTREIQHGIYISKLQALEEEISPTILKKLKEDPDALIEKLDEEIEKLKNKIMAIIEDAKS